MSYANHDHAGWVERNAEACRAMFRANKPRRDRHGKVIGWHASPEKLSPFQSTVMNILGLSMGGIYNAPICWKSVDWGGGDERWAHMHIPIHRGAGLSTYDLNRLTTLVLACHEARIRLDISPHGVGGMMLSFHRRHATGGYSARHPNIDQAVAEFREYIGDNHPIRYREKEAADA